MKVRELIHLLAELDPTAEVVPWEPIGRPPRSYAAWQMVTTLRNQMPLPANRRPLHVAAWVDGFTVPGDVDQRALYLVAVGDKNA